MPPPSKRPPPGFSAKPATELDEAALSSMFRMALDDSSQDQFFAQQQRFQQEYAAPPQQQQQYQQAPPQQQQQYQQAPPQQHQYQQQQQPPPAFFQTPAPFVFQPHRGGGGAPPPAAEQQQAGRFPDFKYMKGREIGQIVRNQLRQVDTGDEYADDYYFLHFTQKRALLAQAQAQTPEEEEEEDTPTDEQSLMSMLKSLHERAKTAPSSSSPNNQLPLPSMKKTAPAAAVSDAAADNALQLQLKWFDKTNALGRTQKSNIRTPKELIALDTATTPTAAGLGFSSRGWELRQVSLDVADALGRVLDLTQLLLAKQRAVQVGWGDQVQQVVADLERQKQDACQALAQQMGLVSAGAGAANDDVLVNLLWLPKGRRLALKASEVLPPAYQLLLVQSACRLMVYFACTTPTAQAKKSREGLELDLLAARVLKELIARRLQTLGEVKDCFRMLLKSNTPESLAFIVSTPAGGDVVKTLLFHGQALADAAAPGSSTDAAEWAALFQDFIDMAERGLGGGGRS